MRGAPRPRSRANPRRRRNQAPHVVEIVGAAGVELEQYEIGRCDDRDALAVEIDRDGTREDGVLPASTSDDDVDRAGPRGCHANDPGARVERVAVAQLDLEVLPLEWRPEVALEHSRIGREHVDVRGRPRHPVGRERRRADQRPRDRCRIEDLADPGEEPQPAVGLHRHGRRPRCRSTANASRAAASETPWVAQ